MRLLPLLTAACLTGCGTNLTLISPPVDQRLLVRCGEQIAQPLATADQYDLARALAQATKYGTVCAARQAELIDAIESRNKLLDSVATQLERKN
jgi:hypothetical protein